MSIKLKKLKPFGLQVSPVKQGETFGVVSGSQLLDWVREHSLVLLRGFHSIEKAGLVDYAKGLGPLLEWEFGHVMEMHEKEDTKNYLFTNGPVPFHWDGAFHQVPRYLLFHCIEAPEAMSGGETLFCNTQLIWQSASEAEKAKWRTQRLIYATEKLAHYGGRITEKLAQRHPDTQQMILRFAEPVPTHMLNPVAVSVEGMDADKSERFIKSLAKRCYQPNHCYTHQWQKDDFLIADNDALIHGRHAYQKFSPRHLRRIQIMREVSHV